MLKSLNNSDNNNQGNGVELPSEQNLGVESSNKETSLKDFESLKNNYLILAADFANYKKRELKEREFAVDKAINQTAKPLLKIAQDIELAISHDDKHPLINQIRRELTSALEGLGFSFFGEIGDPFDSRLHDALEYSQEKPGESLRVSKIFQRGVVKDGELISPAIVGVGGAEIEPEKLL